MEQSQYKPILHISISRKFIKDYHKSAVGFVKSLKQHFREKYNCIITPEGVDIAAENTTVIVIHIDGTDPDDIISKIKEIEEDIKC